MLSIEERETLISYSEIDTRENPERGPVWDLYTTQSTMMRKIEKLGIKPYKVDRDSDGEVVSKNYKIPFKQIIFAKERKPVVIDEERREKLRLNMKSLQEKRMQKLKNKNN